MFRVMSQSRSLPIGGFIFLLRRGGRVREHIISFGCLVRMGFNRVYFGG